MKTSPVARSVSRRRRRSPSVSRTTSLRSRTTGWRVGLNWKRSDHGTRQSGLPTLRIGDLVRDQELMEQATGLSQTYAAEEMAEAREIARRPDRLFTNGSNLWLTREERDRALKEMSGRYVYFRPGDQPSLEFEKVDK